MPVIIGNNCRKKKQTKNVYNQDNVNNAYNSVIIAIIDIVGNKANNVNNAYNSVIIEIMYSVI